LVTLEVQNITFKNIEAVIFDKDGTLEDSADFLRNLAQKRSRLIDAQIPGVGEPLLMAFGVQGDSLDPTGLMAVGSRRENEMAAAAYIAETGRGWLESVNIAHHAFADADQYLKSSPPSTLFVGGLETLKSLSDAGLKLGIVSAAPTAEVQNFVTHHQLEPYINFHQGVDAGPTKPDPILFLNACQALGVDPANTLMVGDAQGDIDMAIGAGAAGCVGVCWNRSNPQHLNLATVVISHWDQLKIKSLTLPRVSFGDS
jgi:haloacid dehalogenase superfamily, subfamily IA, variant 3 with third motif having DD or ED/haloacid dehalogenase superfamily, subfamily IA, variant 1 with third motif having Dx(3-4)D or Dx(3-4)E